MTLVEITLYVLILAPLAIAFLLFILLGTKQGSPKLLAVCLIAGGVGMLGGLSRYQYRLAIFGARYEGVVVAMQNARGGYRPVVKFSTAEGNEVEFRCKHGVPRDSYAVGESVSVAYLESDPSFAVVASRVSLYQPLVLGTLISLVPIVGGAFLLRRINRGTTPSDR